MAAELLGKGVYTRSKAIYKVQSPALIRQYVEQHASINNSKCRDLLLLGNRPSGHTTLKWVPVHCHGSAEGVERCGGSNWFGEKYGS
ncbi:MAG: hypothetical protein BM485_04415 [Desulfobulbaceae bacterium DB1]|nr:MAG: hypothetical protein BM485_04415 [Desulfobulbaceae bacterium DB1]